MSRSSTYSEISSLGSQLASETQVKKRRDAGQKLLSLLSNPSVRSRLAKEASPSFSSSQATASAKRKALSQLWRVLIRNALMAASKATSGRGKLNLDDVMLPYRFLCLCDIPTGKQDAYQDDGTLHMGTKLSRTEILDLLKYCLNMLADEDAVAVAENDLLTMLHHLCGREDYVAHYRPHGEINNILAELDIRLSSPELEESTTSHSVFLSAAKTFSNLLQSCQQLGTGMHLLIPSCIEVVSKWCEYHLRGIATARGSSSQALPYMYAGATALMNAHPEQVIAPLSRHGRPMLRFAKRCFPHSQGFNKSALTEYFMAHLIVCQAAESLQGLLPGDLGDLGPASLDGAEIDSLLSLVTSETELEKVLSTSDPSLATRHAPRYKSARKQRRTTVPSQLSWSPPSQRQRCHLELCARLLACAQRIHVGQAEWNVNKDPLQAMLDKIVEARKEGDEYFFLQQPVNPFISSPLPNAPESEIAKCPWMTVIAQHLWMVTPQAVESARRLQSAIGSQPEGASQESKPGSSNDVEQSNDLSQQFPVLNLVSQSLDKDLTVNMKLVVHLLQLTCACAEAFPGGECWTSRTQTNWRTFAPEDLLENDVIHCNACSPQDLALVVFLVSNTLEQSGGPGGDPLVQTWALLCLIRLTETSAIIYQRFSQDGLSTDLLSLQWRRVWGTLFRPELLYTSSTDGAITNSNGEFVLVLLTEMVRNCCTDPSVKWSLEAHPGNDATFMHANQWQVWSLPAFSDALPIQSSAAFELVYAMLVYAGLSEQGRDAIDGRTPYALTAEISSSHEPGDQPNLHMGRRRRLLNLVFRKVVEATAKIEFESNRLVLPAATACLSVLLGGEAVDLSTTFSLESFSRFCFTEILGLRFDFHGQPMGLPPSSKSFFASLWDTSRMNGLPYHDIHLSGASRYDFAIANASRARNLVLAEERRFLLKNSGSASSSQSEALHDFVTAYMQHMLPMLGCQSNESGESADDAPIDSSPDSNSKQNISRISSFALSSLTASLKVYMTVVIPNDSGSASSDANVEEIEGAVMPLFDEVLSRLPSFSSDSTEFLLVSTDLYQLLNAITKFFMREDTPVISRGLVAKIKSIFEMCWSMLAEYTDTSSDENQFGKEGRGATSRGRARKLPAVDFDSDYSDHANYNTGRVKATTDDSDSDDQMSNKRKRTSQLGKRAKRRMSEAVDRPRSHPGNGTFQSVVASSRPPNGACARVLASIVILLRPSVASCQLVAETLLWPCLNENYANNGLAMQELDPEDSSSCLELLCTEESIFHHRYLRVLAEVGHQSDAIGGEDSIISLCCTAIRAIRAGSGPSPHQHLSCLLKCAELIAIGESDLRGAALAMDDCKEIIGVLKSEDSKLERRSLKLRPQFRSTRLRAATRAFRKGREVFHRNFDHMFATKLVIPSLCDISEPVRANACSAVGAALRVLEDQHRIVDSVLMVLPPLTPSKNEKKIMSAFRRWYEDKDLGSQGALTAVENAVWDDARLSLEAASVRCRGFIAGSTSNSVIFRDVLWDLVRLSSVRPDLEAACFGACERASLIRGFRCAEEMLQDEGEWLLHSWLEAKLDLSSMPLLMTSPSLLRQLLQAGQFPRLRLPQGADKHLDVNQLRVDAVSEYIKRSAHLLVPIVLFLYPESLVHGSLSKEGSRDSSGKKERQSERGWEYLSEACYHLDISVGGDDANVTKVLLKSHLADIIAYIFPVAQADCDGGTSSAMVGRASKALELFEMKLSEVTSFNKQRNKNAHFVVRRILQLCGKHELALGESELPRDSYVSAVLNLLKQLQESGGASIGNRGLFDDVSISFTECLLYAKAWLHESVIGAQQQKSFSVVEVVCDLFIKQLKVSKGESSEIGFCIHIILDVLLEVQGVRNRALGKLKEMLHEVFGLNYRNQGVENEVSSTLYKLLGTLLHLHETSQRSLLAQCTMARLRENERMKRSLGLILLRDSESPGVAGDLWGWGEEDSIQADQGQRAVREHAREVDKQVEKTIVGTYEVLELILECRRSSLDSLLAGPLLTLTRNSKQHEFLAATDKKFYAQTLVLDAFEIAGSGKEMYSHEEEVLELQTFAKSLANGRSLMHLLQIQPTISPQFSTVHIGHEKGSLGIETTLLLAEIHEVFGILRRSRQSGRSLNDGSIPGRVIYLLVQELLKLCDSRAPEEVRCGASRCLGELGPSGFAALSSLDLESLCGYDLDAGQLNGDIFLPSVRAKSLELLSQYLKSPRVQTSLTAMETIKALLCTDEGVECWRLIKDKDCKQLLQPLRKKTLAPAQVPYTPNRYLASLMSVIDSDPEASKEDAVWCWNEKLWVCAEEGEVPYEDWVRHLVCSIIFCCYSEKGLDPNSGGFFHRCLKMSALEHGFAAAIFPGIVFDLLNSCQGDDLEQDSRGKRDKNTTETGMSDSYFGNPESLIYRKLSQCFGVLLGGGAMDTTSKSSPDSRAVALAVDALDMLRLVTQHHFMSSTNHKMNPRTLASRSYPNQGKSNSRRSPVTKPSPDKRHYNQDIEPAPKWGGVPFGIVLNLDSLQVAKACMYAKRYASALFYAEMYADNRFGGSTGVLERVSNELVKIEVFSSLNSVACNGNKKQQFAGIEEKEVTNGILSSALALAEMLQRCYLELHEYDASGAVETSIAALQFSIDDVSPSVKSGPLVSRSTLDDLRMLDAQRSMRRACASTSLLVANCIGDLGLKNTLRTYIEGIVGGETRSVLGSLSGSDRLNLRDKWFEGSLQSMQWDESLLEGSSSASLAQTDLITNVTANPPMGLVGDNADEFGLNHSTGNTVAGFYESIAETFGALLQDDTETCCHRLVRARHCLLDDIQKALTPESVLTGMDEFAERLQVLNDLQDLATGDSTSQELVLRWGIGDEQYDRNKFVVEVGCEDLDADVMWTTCHGVQEFAHSVQEIILKILCFKTPSSEDFDPEAALTSHLWRFCSTARRHGNPDIANASLQRLSQVLRTRRRDASQMAMSLETTLRLRFEEAKILEARGDFSAAIRTGKLLVSHLNHMKIEGNGLSRTSAILLSEALLKCGVWMDEYKVEPAEAILQTYLKPASEMAWASYEQMKSKVTAARSSLAYFHLAELVANLFDSVSARTESIEWKRAGIFVADRRKELKTCQELLDEKSNSARKQRKSVKDKQQAERYNKEYQDLYTHTRRLEKELELMTCERQKIEESIPGFLHLAIQSYGAALSISDSSQDISRHVFRMVSLWFSNCAGTEGAFNRTVGTMVDKIPSFRFVPLTYQIFSRIGSDGSGCGDEDFQEALERLVRRMCEEHPYHCLVQLLALYFGKKVGSGVDGRQADDYLRNIGESKVTAAKEIIASFYSSAPSFVSDLIDSYTALMDSYVDLAMAPTEEFHKAGTKGIPLSNVPGSGRLDRCLGSGSRRLFQCPPCVLTKPPPLRPGADYGDGKTDPIGGERVQGFQSTFSITETGLHRPKIVMCIGTKGSLFKQLVKGKEDVRSDAVMEQVFTYVNDLMKRRGSSRPSDSKDEGSKKGATGSYSASLQRQLKLVTYGVVPLSPTCGVLEWVVNTVPFGDYLVDKGKKGTAGYYVGAHSKYYPGEWGQQLCQTHYRNAPPDAKRETFDVICEHYSPAFRFFFVERFSRSLQAWHAAKMTYTRSCAVSSIVGHMLGIGDRHIQNILVHEKTGEVVHIDFGIVFEQGKSLTIPETVPFRLTRDIVDGMGPCGTEGTFSRAAEATAAVLRENTNALLTILSAVVADPLYRWSVSPIQARELQRVSDEDDSEDHVPEENRTKNLEDTSQAPENQNEAATRALARIHEKLQGYEDGTSGERQSVEGQVQLLINSARDPNNLCKIFQGWAPWM